MARTLKFMYLSVLLNKNFVARLHVDPNKDGPSVMMGMGPGSRPRSKAVRAGTGSVHSRSRHSAVRDQNL